MKKVVLALSFIICHLSSGFAQSEAQIVGVRKLNPTTAEVLTKDGNRITIDFYGSAIFRMFEDPNGGEIRDPEAMPPARILVDNPRCCSVGIEVGEDAERQTTR